MHLSIRTCILSSLAVLLAACTITDPAHVQRAPTGGGQVYFVTTCRVAFNASGESTGATEICTADEVAQATQAFRFAQQTDVPRDFAPVVYIGGEEWSEIQPLPGTTRR